MTLSPSCLRDTNACSVSNFCHPHSIYLGGTEPAVLALESVHLCIKGVEVLVAEQVVIHQIELATGVVERVAVARTGEVHPPVILSIKVSRVHLLGVSKLVAFEIQIGLTPQ